MNKTVATARELTVVKLTHSRDGNFLYRLR